MRKLTLLLCGLLGVSAAMAEPGDIMWSRHIVEASSFSDLVATPDLDLVCVGNIGDNIAVVKTDFEGTVLWAAEFGDDLEEEGRAVALDPDGSIIVVGDNESLANDEQDAWILKLDSSGNEIWSRQITRLHFDSFNEVEVTSEGNYVAAGFSDVETLTPDGMVTLFDPDGNVIWNTFTGGAGVDVFYGVSQTDDGGYFAAGYSDSDSGNYDYWLVRLDGDGNVLWSRTYGGELIERGMALELTAEGTVVIGGSKGDLMTDSFFLMLTLDMDGNLLASNDFPGQVWNAGNDIIQLDDGGFAMAGWHNGPDFYWRAWVLRVDSGLVPIWEVQYEDSYSSSTAISLIADQTGDIVVSGQTFDPSGWFGVSRGLLMKINDQTPVATQLPDLALAGINGEVALELTYRTDLFEGVNLYRRVGAQEIRLNDQILSDPQGRVTFTGQLDGIFAGTEVFFSFGMIINGVEIERSSEYAYTVSRNEIPVSFTVAGNYPNPFNPTTTIKFSVPYSGHVRLAVYSLNGRLVRTLVNGYRDASEYEAVWDGKDETGMAAASGVYFCRLTSDKGQRMHKMTLMK